MTVKISGVLKDGTGKPVQNCTIVLKARRTSSTVVVNTVASENPDEAGRYSMDVEHGQYSVTLLVEGFPPSHAGTITVYEGSRPGTLNDFLGAMTEDDVRPEALRRFEQMVEEVSRNASAVAQNTAAAKKSASDASASASEAATHATDAAASARAASTSAGQAASSAQSASSSAGTASTKAREAAKSAAAAESSKSAAATSASAAKTSETNAAASQKSAATSASTATTKASEAATSARGAAASKEAAKSSETNASSSASSAASSATAAGNSAKAAKTSETNAKSSETAAGQSASAAAGSKTAAALSASAASTSAGQASASATAAGKSAESAASSASTATTKAGKATEQATAAARSASAAKTSETNAKTSADNAASSKAAAASSASSAASSASSASASKDEATRQASAAKGSATTASTKATEAAGSATAAAQSKSTAESAATRAETAAKRAEDIASAVALEDASTTKKGIVQLSSATNSTSESLAATPKAVKAVMGETNKKAPLNSPALTGTPTTPTARQGTNNTQIASTAYVMAAIAALVDSSPDALNTLNELAAALGNDPNFATTMTSALAGKQPKDATLTALAGLATAADRFPYFTGNDVASLATLTKVGRDILAKSTVAAVIEYLGLQETVNKAGNAVQRSGDKMTGELKIGTVNALRIFNDAFGLIFRRSEDFLHFIPTAEGQGENGDIGPLRPFAINLRTGAISVSHGAKIDGGLALGTDNALGGNSITLGDNDTGIKQGGDGVLLFYSNGQLAFGLQPASADFYKRVAYIHQGIIPDGSGAFADQLNNATAPFVQTQFAWNPTPGGLYVPIVKGLSIRNGQGYPGAVSFGYLLTEQYGFPVPCIHMRGDGGNDALWQFNPNDKSFISPGALIAGGVRYNTDGNIFGGCWGSNLNDYLNSSFIRNVRLGGRRSDTLYRGGLCEPGNGHVTTGLQIIGEVDGDDWMVSRPLQKYISGNWYNVEQA
ncbi:prophage tail fiber N-terminal domain-containing protein [Escherichia coli]|uniref:prophage tail fiber N-terminal domain-containing protein n=1 Tax=Escherichia coli TaxID=562 RepID=UPI0015EA1BE9|nr:prophage tail fiber N-terminal domain-containing protein [Escherichia coli]MCC9279757.1 prophage tail fiber N-terminal domain-containing protein [Escherichia coli]MCD9274999.1 prophage tail fiber N-terminal domain-containing protein [Escherichia coli]MDK9630231.1 prophage tail fiber N-terminal domain-containing protein [Escherichia coli]QLZ90750.1 prophage tail fiber N-terminal domain-containing protein [Escherichia coli]WLN01036.1 prophage tail fiber N-terminal domain-containing protein [E